MTEKKTVKIRAIHSLILSNQRNVAPGAEAVADAAEAAELVELGAAELVRETEKEPAPAPKGEDKAPAPKADDKAPAPKTGA